MRFYVQYFVEDICCCCHWNFYKCWTLKLQSILYDIYVTRLSLVEVCHSLVVVNAVLGESGLLLPRPAIRWVCMSGLSVQCKHWDNRCMYNFVQPQTAQNRRYLLTTKINITRKNPWFTKLHTSIVPVFTLDCQEEHSHISIKNIDLMGGRPSRIPLSPNTWVTTITL